MRIEVGDWPGRWRQLTRHLLFATTSRRSCSHLFLQIERVTLLQVNIFEMAKVAVIVPVLLFTLLVKSSEAVRCWSCSSDLDPTRPDCDDPFLPGQSINPGYFRLENCDANAGATYPYLTQSKTACKKQKKLINGQLVVSRGCTWKRQDDTSNTCPATSNGPNEHTIFCETCEYDGCNGAGAISKTLALLLVPFSILLFK